MVSGVAPNISSMGIFMANPIRVISPDARIINIKLFPNTRSAFSMSRRPMLMDTSTPAPMPISMPKAITINMTGKITDTALKATALTPWPIKIRSTILYRAFTNTPIKAGIKYFSIRRGILPSPNSLVLSIKKKLSANVRIRFNKSSMAPFPLFFRKYKICSLK